VTHTDVRQKQTDQFRKEYRKMVLWKRVSAAAAVTKTMIMRLKSIDSLLADCDFVTKNSLYSSLLCMV
jgi:molybdopterin-guanine dinucleotide biosynthesis protein